MLWPHRDGAWTRPRWDWASGASVVERRLTGFQSAHGAQHPLRELVRQFVRDARMMTAFHRFVVA